jgi:hypothetical protein
MTRTVPLHRSGTATAIAGTAPTEPTLTSAASRPASTAPSPVNSIPTGAPRRVARRNGPATVALRDGFWRVLHPSGAVLGYIERTRSGDAEHFESRRLIAGTIRIIPLGEFWSFDTALDCFGY